MLGNRLNSKCRKKVIENCLNNARQLGYVRKPIWHYKKALKGWYYNITRDSAIAFARQLDSMITVLNDVYENNWDFDFYVDINNKFHLKVVIRFPKIEITNENQEKHIIEDLFVCFDVLHSYSQGLGNSYFKNLYGTRGTLSYIEWVRGYFHSHLGTVDVSSSSLSFYLKEFCLGVDTEVINVEEALALEYDENMFQMYLYCIRTLVEWESLEGTPYKYIKDLTISSESEEIVRISKNTCHLYYNLFRGLISSLDVDFVLQNGKYKIVKNQKAKDFIKSVVIQFDIEYYPKLLVIRDEQNRFMSYASPETVVNPNVPLRDSEGNPPKYLFRGEEIPFKIHLYDGEKPNLDAYFVHPSFINYVIEQLENELYEKTVRKHTIERYHQSQNVSANIG